MASIKSNVSLTIARNSLIEVFGLGNLFLAVRERRPVRVDVVHATKNASSSKESGPVRGPVGLGRAEAFSRAVEAVEAVAQAVLKTLLF